MARYTLIKGEYHIYYPDLPRGGPEPGGDTIKFQPANPGHWSDLCLIGEDRQGSTDTGRRVFVSKESTPLKPISWK